MGSVSSPFSLALSITKTIEQFCHKALRKPRQATTFLTAWILIRDLQVYPPNTARGAAPQAATAPGAHGCSARRSGTGSFGQTPVGTFTPEKQLRPICCLRKSRHPSIHPPRPRTCPTHFAGARIAPVPQLQQPDLGNCLRGLLAAEAAGRFTRPGPRRKGRDTLPGSASPRGLRRGPRLVLPRRLGRPRPGSRCRRGAGAGRCRGRARGAQTKPGARRLRGARMGLERRAGGRPHWPCRGGGGASNGDTKWSRAPFPLHNVTFHPARGAAKPVPRGGGASRRDGRAGRPMGGRRPGPRQKGLAFVGKGGLAGDSMSGCAHGASAGRPLGRGRGISRHFSILPPGPTAAAGAVGCSRRGRPGPRPPRHGAAPGPQALPARQAAAAGGAGRALRRAAHAGGLPHPRVSARPRPVGVGAARGRRSGPARRGRGVTGGVSHVRPRAGAAATAPACPPGPGRAGEAPSAAVCRG